MIDCVLHLRVGDLPADLARCGAAHAPGAPGIVQQDQARRRAGRGARHRRHDLLQPCHRSGRRRRRQPHGVRLGRALPGPSRRQGGRRSATAAGATGCSRHSHTEAGERVIRTYDIEKPLFFASARNFKALFDYDNDPDEVEIHCLNMQIMDYSALEAIGTVASDYAARGKRLHLRFLKEEGHRQLAKGRGMLKDLASWRVVRVAEDEEVDINAAVIEDHIEVLGEAKQKHYGADGLVKRRPSVADGPRAAPPPAGCRKGCPG